MITYYLSGPMRHRPEYNYPAFNAVERALWAHLSAQCCDEAEVVNPARNFGGRTDLPLTTYMQTDIAQVLEADVIVLLPEWETSEYARLEADIGKATGKRFVLAEWVVGMYDGTGAWIFSAVDKLPHVPETPDQEARRLVYGERAKVYGHPRGDFDRVAAMWSAMLGIEISAEMVAVMMVAFKLARLSQTPLHHDSQVDVIGYVLCLDRLKTGE